MRGSEPVPLIGWVVLPLVCAACAAVAAALHYGAAARRGAGDLPNLPLGRHGLTRTGAMLTAPGIGRSCVELVAALRALEHGSRSWGLTAGLK